MNLAPITPAALLAWLARLPSHRRACLECGAGLGEIARFMAGRFEQVFALDLVVRAPTVRPDLVHILCADAGTLPFAGICMDLVISMQALHHFNVTRHLGEARRVVRPGGVFAALSWGRIRLPAEIEGAYRPVFSALHGYWEENRTWSVDGYPSLAFDGEPLALPPAEMKRTVSLDALDATIARWSATQRALTAGADIPDPALTRRQRKTLKSVEIAWPLQGRAFRVV